MLSFFRFNRRLFGFNFFFNVALTTFCIEGNVVYIFGYRTCQQTFCDFYLTSQVTLVFNVCSVGEFFCQVVKCLLTDGCVFQACVVSSTHGYGAVFSCVAYSYRTAFSDYAINVVVNEGCVTAIACNVQVAYAHIHEAVNTAQVSNIGCRCLGVVPYCTVFNCQGKSFACNHITVNISSIVAASPFTTFTVQEYVKVHASCVTCPVRTVSELYCEILCIATVIGNRTVVCRICCSIDDASFTFHKFCVAFAVQYDCTVGYYFISTCLVNLNITAIFKTDCNSTVSSAKNATVDCYFGTTSYPYSFVVGLACVQKTVDCNLGIVHGLNHCSFAACNIGFQGNGFVSVHGIDYYFRLSD